MPTHALLSLVATATLTSPATHAHGLHPGLAEQNEHHVHAALGTDLDRQVHPDSPLDALTTAISLGRLTRTLEAGAEGVQATVDRPALGLPAAGAAAGGVWLALRQCESGDDYTIDTGNGYYGAYQFSAETWWALGYRGLPNQAPAPIQDGAARRLQARAGWGQWPVCSAKLGLT